MESGGCITSAFSVLYIRFIRVAVIMVLGLEKEGCAC